ncbi:fumarylacetoacetate hydrolase family protein [Bordetella sp. FB-8]|uniref:fumarylacetoacetate hydrolase family protein n=1 Tax=Bordetella sp. FB-8 TaxID=1159870 RepID=UPI00036DC5AF|nr:fumarylacetoacetate hydrolase family protein [Bordetella sp. FB-8]
MTFAPPSLFYDDPPYRLSGVVYGPLLNQRCALERLGDAVDQPPYKGAPKGPVLYMKPRNTLACDGQRIAVPDGVQAMRVGATLGLVVGRTACRVSAATALDHVAGLVLVADLTVPHDTFYRPSAPFVARDASCFIGPRIIPLAQVGDPNAVTLSVRVGETHATACLADMVRPAARLLADVTEFMTLSVGDLLLLGTCADMPLLGRGQAFVIGAPGMDELHGGAQ